MTDWKALLPFLIPILTAVGGATGSAVVDVSGARSWQAANHEQIVEAERVRARNVALEAQQEILMQLANRCYLEPAKEGE